MKTIRGFLLTLLLCLAIGAFTPVSSQDNPSPRTTTENYDDDNDGGNYSWVGLLGLIGLAGLIRKDRNVPVTRGSVNPAQTNY